MSYQTSAAAVEQYRNLGIKSEVESASPHRLIQMLMERFLTKVTVAKRQMEASQIAEKGAAISDAISIVNCLQVSLNHEPNAKLASNFDALYDYMARRLLESNMNNDPAGLAEVISLMTEIKTAWDLIGEELAAGSDNGSPAATTA